MLINCAEALLILSANKEGRKHRLLEKTGEALVL